MEPQKDSFTPPKPRFVISQSMQKTPSNEPLHQIRSIPTANPIRYPTPDTLSNFERLPFTRKPGGFFSYFFFFKYKIKANHSKKRKLC